MQLEQPTNPVTGQVVILSTGGTIGSHSTSQGIVLSDGGDMPLLRRALATRRVTLPPGVVATLRPVMNKDSSQLSNSDLLELRHAVDSAMSEPTTIAVIILHGTDTLEETALWLDITHHDTCPVLLTGSQKPPDHPSTDAVSNLADALNLAVSPAARDLGVIVVFGGNVFPSIGIRKWHTTASSAFVSTIEEPSSQTERFILASVPPIDRTRVDIVETYPGSDDTAINALIGTGAQGIVLVGMGSGNIPSSAAQAIARHPDVVFIMTTRVPRGGVSALYGGAGGGAELSVAGVIGAGRLSAGQSRMLLTSLLADEQNPQAIADVFCRLG